MSPAKPSPDKREAIFCATIKLLAQYGFHGFSIKQLAEEAGVATGTIYLYFKDREDLIRELNTQIINDFVKASLEGHDPQLPLKQQYQHICFNIWQFCIENSCITHCKAQFDHLPPDVLRSQHSHAWDGLQPLKHLFEQGRKTQKIKNLPDDILISFSIEPYLYLARQHLLDIIKVDSEQLTHIIDASWDAIAGPASKNTNRQFPQE
jgi:TetR/AcrR family transcriptional repressor of multidrug resistance operon